MPKKHTTNTDTYGVLALSFLVLHDGKDSC